MVLLIVIFTIFGSIRYALFYNRHKDTLETLFVPDGTIDWMIHAAKAAADAELGIKDRLHFQRATFSREPSNTPDRLARVQSGVALSDMKPPKAKSGRASIKKGAIVTVKEISDDSLAPSSSAGLDGRGSSVTVVTLHGRNMTLGIPGRRVPMMRAHRMVWIHLTAPMRKRRGGNEHQSRVVKSSLG